MELQLQELSGELGEGSGVSRVSLAHSQCSSDAETKNEGAPCYLSGGLNHSSLFDPLRPSNNPFLACTTRQLDPFVSLASLGASATLAHIHTLILQVFSRRSPKGKLSLEVRDELLCRLNLCLHVDLCPSGSSHGRCCFKSQVAPVISSIHPFSARLCALTSLTLRSGRGGFASDRWDSGWRSGQFFRRGLRSLRFAICDIGVGNSSSEGLLSVEVTVLTHRHQVGNVVRRSEMDGQVATDPEGQQGLHIGSPLTSQSHSVTTTPAVGVADVVRRSDLKLARLMRTPTQSISRRSSSSVAPGKATLYMVVRETALVSYRRRMKACAFAPVWISGMYDSVPTVGTLILPTTISLPSRTMV